MILVTGATGKFGREVVRDFRRGDMAKVYPLSGPENLSNAPIAEKLSAATGKTIGFVGIPEAAFRAALVESGDQFARDHAATWK